MTNSSTNSITKLIKLAATAYTIDKHCDLLLHISLFHFSKLRATYIIAKLLLIMSIKTFVFFDSETTGLPQFEKYQTKITEVCLISVQASDISAGVKSRVQHKLVLCFNPVRDISSEATKLTGLSNDKLKNESPFNAESLELLIKFLNRLPKPICLVAHNGIKFDYPILRTHIEHVGTTFSGDIMCIDSLSAFRAILPQCDNYGNKVSFKLVDIYQRLIEKEPINAHTAEADVQMLIECAMHLKDSFVNWAEKNTHVFNDIPKMEPKKININTFFD